MLITTYKSLAMGISGLPELLLPRFSRRSLVTLKELSTITGVVSNRRKAISPRCVQRGLKGLEFENSTETFSNLGIGKPFLG